MGADRRLEFRLGPPRSRDLSGSCADYENTGTGAGDGERILPGEVWEGGACEAKLSGADQQSQAASGDDQAGGDGECATESLDSAEDDDVERGVGGEGFGTAGEYIDVRQCKGTDKFTQEGGFLVVGLDQSERDVRGPELEGYAGEAGAGADVGDGGTGQIFQHRGHRGRRGNAGEQMAGGEEGFAEVAGDDFFRVADRGQVDAGIPAEEYIDIRRYVPQLSGR